MMRVAVLDDDQSVASSSADWRSLSDVQITFFSEHLEDDALVDALAAFDAVVAMRERTPLGRAVLERLPRLRLLVTTGRANAAIDVRAANERGITVCGTDSISTGAVELTWALILALLRHVPALDAAMHAGRWERRIGSDLAGRTLGVVGLGRIGSKVAQVGRSFGMDVLAWSRSLTAERAREAGVRCVERVQLFRDADVVTVHVVLREATRGLVAETEIASMKPTAVLVNTSRGPIVDEAALVRALERGDIAGAALDVYDEEPLPTDHPLRVLPNVVLTPHVGYVTHSTYRTYYAGAVEDIAAFMAGAPLRVLRPGDG